MDSFCVDARGVRVPDSARARATRERTRYTNATEACDFERERERDVMNEGRVVMRLQKFVTTRDTTVTGYGI